MSDARYDYAVIGSGAGGGPLAANLAMAGFRVLVLEAGGDPCSEDETGRLMYEVPIYHPDCTEYPHCAWDFFVRHYTDDERQAKDSKAESVDGKAVVWYPRASTLGGCTAHNAMITVVPQDGDWNYIADITGDDSWRAEHMRGYFTRLENCKYVPRPGSAKAKIRGLASSITELLEGEEDWRDWTHGHGFDGWLATSDADPKLILKDPELIGVVLDAVKEALRDRIGNPLTGLESRFDPNDSRTAEYSPEGLAFTPLAVAAGRRNGPRERLLSVQKACQEKRDQNSDFRGELIIRTHALATRIIFEGTRAVGVEYIDKAHVYRADPQAGGDPFSLPRSEIRVDREVIVAGGAFNSPQLLMLSGVGPRAALEGFGIPVVVDLAGVGENLQDRYELGVVSRFARDFSLLEGAEFDPLKPDTFLQLWQQSGSGVYASNGVLLGIIKRSNSDLKEPDLYIFGLPGFFKGYYRGYSRDTMRLHSQFTWSILKARTNNRGSVRLNSANPWDKPCINFKYFGDGARTDDPDLEAVLSAVKFVRAMNERLAALGLIEAEEIPGDAVSSDDQVREFIKNEAWGHHACGTCKIGADDDSMAVLDSRFRVRGTEGLRVVDASVFPRIPGYFIATPIYMISEKASDAILEDATR
jgi:choline dehydrogenase